MLSIDSNEIAHSNQHGVVVEEAIDKSITAKKMSYKASSLDESQQDIEGHACT